VLYFLNKYIAINTLFRSTCPNKRWIGLTSKKLRTCTNRKRHEATTRSPVSCPEGSQRPHNQRYLAASSFSPQQVRRLRSSERATCLIISSKRWSYLDAKSTSKSIAAYPIAKWAADRMSWWASWNLLGSRK